MSTDLPSGLLLLDFIRYYRHLTGTKIGCREGDCGACTVLVGEIKNDRLVYHSVTSCLMPLGNAAGKHIVTIEGINTEGLNFIQQCFADEGATQCGFCTPGFVVSLAGFCLGDTHSAEAGIDAVNGNICRCTGYKSIERAINNIATKLAGRDGADAVEFAVANKIVPAYFKDIKSRLALLGLPLNGIATGTSGTKKFLGGGTDLYVPQQEAMVDADINFLFDRNDLKGIQHQASKCIIGASVTVTELLESPVFQQYFPALKKYIKLVSSTQIRNMATIGGNIINGSPIGDFTVFLLSLDAGITLRDGDDTREMPLRHLFKAYKTLDKTPTEYIGNIYFDLPAASNYFNFEKVSKRTHLDIASVNTAIYLELQNDQILKAGLSAGGVGPIPLFLKKSSAFLEGKNISPDLINRVIEIAQTEISPISDARGTATYKRLLLGQLIKAHFITLFPGLKIKKLISASS